jgi:tetratricopeptide (TPR) repeat protein/DNA-binding CsgD family transcriptional regulator
MKLTWFVFLFTSACLAQQSEIKPAEGFSGLKDTSLVNRLNAAALRVRLTNPELTELYASRALALADSLQYKKGLADSYYASSLISRLKADDAEELDYHMKALKILEEIGDSSSLARTYNEIGVVYHDKGDFELAADFYTRSLKIYQRRHNIFGIATTLRRIGNMEMDQKHYDKCLDAYQRSLDAERSINNLEGIANSLNNIGVAYYTQGKYKEALPYYNQSFDIIKKINNLNRLPAAYHNLGRVYLAQGNIAKAKAMADMDWPTAQQSRSRYAMMEAAMLVSDVALQENNFQKAYKFLAIHDQIRDSVEQQNTQIEFARLHAIYKTEDQAKELALTKKDHQIAIIRQRIIAGVLMAIVIIGAWIIYLLRRTVRQKQEVISKNQQLHDVQLGLAKAELDNKELNEKQLERDLEFRHKELLTYTLNLVQKNTIMQNLRDAIHDLLGSTDTSSHLKMTKLIKAIDYSLESEKDWDEFRMYFEKVHSSFFNNLKNHFPDLTQSDLKLCALLSLNLSMKEMAELMGISAESVKMARHRLRKKLELQTEENLTEFIASFKQ